MHNSSNAYVREPPMAKLGQRISLLLRYASIVLLGIFCLFYSIPLIIPIGWVLISTGLSSIIGVLSGNYRWEWVALAPMVSALLIAAIVILPVSAGISVMLLMALAFSLIDRLIHLSIVAHILRKAPVKIDTGD